MANTPDWAARWSAETQQRFEDPALFASLQAALDTDARIPYVTRRGEWLYNFWRDADNPRGLWRRTRGFGQPWEVLVDVDKLAAEEKVDWVWKGAVVRRPENDRALIRLSRGGADATEIREFDLETGWVDGFSLPETKSAVAWVDRDTLLVGTDLAVTESGYPAEVRLWHRGQAIEDAEVYASCAPEDITISGSADPVTGRIVVRRALDFYRQTTTVDGQLLEVPEDCSVMVHRDWLLLRPRTAVYAVPAGGLGRISLTEFLAGGRDFELLFVPTAYSSLQAVDFTLNHVVLTVLDEVHTTILIDGTAIDLPDAVTASVVATDSLTNDEVWISAASFHTPATLYRWEGELIEAARAPELFDAAGITTRQHWVTSADGTRLPYFITGDFSRGQRPTLCGGYGGFEVSLTPNYSAVRGIAWLERGNYYVQPNLRGGGEFGPQWHSQVTGLQRHKVWEDHRAVLQDLVARGYCRPEQLAIRGGSNGGLLTAGALTQYPQDFGAAVVQVPLTDMLHYHEWTAGASWIAEYGDPRIPEHREAIRRWSPLQNVTSTPAYPPALVTTSSRDDRVHPEHARRFATALDQAGQPVDYYENSVGGHAGASDNAQVAQVETLIYTWLLHHLPGD